MRAARLAATKNAAVTGGGTSNITYVGKNGIANATGTSTVVPVPASTQAGDIVMLTAGRWNSAHVTISGFSAETWTAAASFGGSNVTADYFWARLGATLSTSLTLTHSDLDSQPTHFMLYAFRGVIGSGTPYRSVITGETGATKKVTTAAITVANAQASDMVAHFACVLAGTTARTITSVSGTGRTLDQVSANTTTNPQSPASGVAYKIADTDTLTWTTSITGYWLNASCALISA